MYGNMWNVTATMNDDDLSPEENKVIGAQVREELARRRLSRQHLADKAKISLSTLEKALTGTRPFTLASVVRIEEALQLQLRKHRHMSNGDMELAPDPWELAPGRLLARRRLPDAAPVVQRCPVGLRLPHRNPLGQSALHLVFRESDRLDAAFKQDGAVSVPHQSGYIYLVTNKMASTASSSCHVP